MKRPTQLDVAKKAGVSRATVSLIINNQANGNVRISGETRQRVLTAVAELDYRPNRNAQNLRTQRTNLIALLVPDITNPYYPLIIRGAQAVAEQQDYQLLIFDSDDTPAREHTFVETILRRRVDGVILNSFHLTPTDISRIINAGTEVVVIGDMLPASDLEISRTSQDHLSAIKALIAYLVQKGHRRIAHIAGPQDTPPGLQRLEDYRRALGEADLVYDPTLVRIGTFREEGIADLVKSLVLNVPEEAKPTAIFAANDVMAIETIHALVALGIQVPGEIAVCGFDDIPQAAWITPTLTTISQSPHEKGRIAANLLLERLLSQEKNQTKHVEVPYQLIIRDST